MVSTHGSVVPLAMFLSNDGKPLISIDQVEEARDQGLNLAFFSGNEVYWRVRWDVGEMVLLGQVSQI